MMHNVTARSYSSAAEMYEAYRARQSRLRFEPAARRQMAAASAPHKSLVAPIAPATEFLREEARAHVDAWQLHKEVEASRDDPYAYVKARCQQLGATLKDIRSESRNAEVTSARGELIFEACFLFPWMTFPQFGRLFKRDHTTIIHALRKACEDRGVGIGEFYAAKARFEQEKVEKIKQMYLASLPLGDIASACSTSVSTVHRLAKQQRWKEGGLKARGEI